MVRAVVLQQLERALDDRIVALVLAPLHFRIDVGRPRARLAGPAADGVERRGAHALALGRFPHGFAAGAPGGIAGIAALTPETPHLRIVEDVRHDAVMLRPAPGIGRGVVDQRDRRKGGHKMPRPGTFALESIEMRRAAMRRIQFGRREAVKQDIDDCAFGF